MRIEAGESLVRGLCKPCGEITIDGISIREDMDITSRSMEHHLCVDQAAWLTSPWPPRVGGPPVVHRARRSSRRGRTS